MLKHQTLILTLFSIIVGLLLIRIDGLTGGFIGLWMISPLAFSIYLSYSKKLNLTLLLLYSTITFILSVVMGIPHIGLIISPILSYFLTIYNPLKITQRPPAEKGEKREYKDEIEAYSFERYTPRMIVISENLRELNERLSWITWHLANKGLNPIAFDVDGSILKAASTPSLSNNSKVVNGATVEMLNCEGITLSEYSALAARILMGYGRRGHQMLAKAIEDALKQPINNKLQRIVTSQSLLGLDDSELTLETIAKKQMGVKVHKLRDLIQWPGLLILDFSSINDPIIRETSMLLIVLQLYCLRKAGVHNRPLIMPLTFSLGVEGKPPPVNFKRTVYELMSDLPGKGLIVGATLYLDPDFLSLFDEYLIFRITDLEANRSLRDVIYGYQKNLSSKLKKLRRNEAYLFSRGEARKIVFPVPVELIELEKKMVELEAYPLDAIIDKLKSLGENEFSRTINVLESIAKEKEIESWKLKNAYGKKVMTLVNTLVEMGLLDWDIKVVERKGRVKEEVFFRVTDKGKQLLVYIGK